MSLGETNVPKEFATNYTVVAMISASARRYALHLLTEATRQVTRRSLRVGAYRPP